jgi:hypothetical protein
MRTLTVIFALALIAIAGGDKSKTTATNQPGRGLNSAPWRINMSSVFVGTEAFDR